MLQARSLERMPCNASTCQVRVYSHGEFGDMQNTSVWDAEIPRSATLCVCLVFMLIHLYLLLLRLGRSDPSGSPSTFNRSLLSLVPPPLCAPTLAWAHRCPCCSPSIRAARHPQGADPVSTQWMVVSERRVDQRREETVENLYDRDAMLGGGHRK